MNMTPKLHIFVNEDSGESVEVMASCLAAATGKLPEDFTFDHYYIGDASLNVKNHTHL
jgi:hypothetical protein